MGLTHHSNIHSDAGSWLEHQSKTSG
jgi:hypothetical protein